MLISLTVGKVDAGVAVLLTEDKRLIEFPSILLPPSISSGSIVDITVARNHTAENQTQESFSQLQQSIFETYGQNSPSQPKLRCRNATQTSVVLEWDPIELATADLRSLSLYRNGVKAGNIPRPLEQTSTKLSGLAIDQEYTFHLGLRTSAGAYSSEKLKVRTHKMTDLSGITVTPGSLPPQLKESLAAAVERIGAKMNDTVRIDTTHFVCIEDKGVEWERAVDNNIPVVRPEWIEGCEREGRIVGVRGYYLDANPKLRQVGTSIGNASQAFRSDGKLSARNQSTSSPGPGGNSIHTRTDSTPPAPPEKDPGQRPSVTTSTNNAQHEDASDGDDDEEGVVSSSSPVRVREDHAGALGGMPSGGPELRLSDRSRSREEDDRDEDKNAESNEETEDTFDDVKL